MKARTTFSPGDPVPWLNGATDGNPRYSFGSTAGRYVVLGFIGSAAHPTAQAAIARVAERRALLDDDKACLFWVTVDPTDRESGRIRDAAPGIRVFRDHDRAISVAFGAVSDIAPDDGPASLSYRQQWLVLDPTLRVLAAMPLAATAEMLDRLERLPAPDRHADTPLHAPVLIVPRVFEHELCRRLIGYYEANGGQDSGFMRDEGGRTVGMIDHRFKRRADCEIADQALRGELRARLHRRLVPEIEKAFQFRATRMERYIVACYDGSEGGGFFRAHRDNTTKGTAHRRFAVTVNLNAGEYEGGDLRFPEFGTTTYRAPTGGAIVFSCSLLHEALPVASGRRFAFLPFLYDDAAAAVRAQNNPHLGAGVAAYQEG